MKDGLENIDEVFKKAFDGFESNVDPSVWNNIQSSISSGSGSSSTPQVEASSVSGVVGKSLVVKIVAGVVLVVAVTTAAFVIPALFKDKEIVIAENIVSDDKVIEEVEESYLTTAEEQNEIGVENEVIRTEENLVVNNNLAVESNKLERIGDLSSANADTETKNSTDNTTEAITAVEEVVKKPVIKKTTPNLNALTKAEELAKLTVNINVDVIKGVAPLAVQFDAIGNGVQYLWEFSDGSEEFGDSPIHVFSIERTYRVKLTAQDKQGNTKVVYKTIIVEKNHKSSIQPLQNIFTPNGDGQNDFIKIRGKNIKKLEVLIMDNKANVIYTIKSMDDFWDGKDKSGDYVAQGQYYMSGMAIGEDGKTHKIKQAINLRR